MIHASLFSGIGGPEVAAKMMGWENAFHCEINPFGRAVLGYWFPESKSYEDITKTSFKEWRGRIDVLTGGFPCQPFSYAGKRGGGERTSVTSGRRCSALLTKSGPLGLSVRMLLESPLWWKEGYVLTWEAKPLCSRRVTNFTDTNLTSPTPSNASAKTLSISDIPSSRCLFRLRLLAHPTEETGCSSSRTMMLITPTSVQMTDPPEKMKERKQKNGYRNGTTYTSLETQVKYDPKVQGLIRTPSAMDARNWENSEYTGGGTLAQEVVQNEKLKGLLPTPRANSAMGTDMSTDFNNQPGRCRNLETVVAKALLPTPTCNDAMNQSLPISQVKRNDSIVKRILTGSIESELLPTPRVSDVKGGTTAPRDGKPRTDRLDNLAAQGSLPTPKAETAEDAIPIIRQRSIWLMPSASDGGIRGNMTMENLRNHEKENAENSNLAEQIAHSIGGGSFRLSPLFTEEMMGFPFLWTVLPFLKQDGEPNPSKPTGTQ